MESLYRIVRVTGVRGLRVTERERESEEKVENWREKEGGGEREREKRLAQQRPRRVWLRRQALQISMAHFVLRLPAHAF